MNSNNYQNRFINHTIISNCSNDKERHKSLNKLSISLTVNQLEELLYHRNARLEFAYKFGREKLDISLIKEEIL
ncbi:MAG: hypothetical protein CMI20_09355 [Opitutae bacterium]|nr:hypothetical protein [Opitutae bacterium]